MILIETRRPGGERALSTAAGSFGARSAALEWGDASPAWGAGASWRAVDGAFDFTIPREAAAAAAGGATRMPRRWTRGRARRWTSRRAAAAARRHRAHGARAAGPGVRAVASRAADAGPRARVALVAACGCTRRADILARWRARRAALPRSRRPRSAWRTTTRPRSARSSCARRRSGGRTARCSTTSASGSTRAGSAFRATSLSDDAPERRLDLGVYAHAGTETHAHDIALSFGAELRADRDALDHGWTLSRSAHARAATDHLELRLANRSSYSPPTLGDQFFRDAVGIEPNPDLRPERVPSEWEVGAGARGALGRGVDASLDVTLYRGDVRGMIVWAPDFRFVWSPRNFDVRRSGGDRVRSSRRLGGGWLWADPHVCARLRHGARAGARARAGRAGDLSSPAYVHPLGVLELRSPRPSSRGALHG